MWKILQGTILILGLALLVGTFVLSSGLVKLDGSSFSGNNGSSSSQEFAGTGAPPPSEEYKQKVKNVIDFKKSLPLETDDFKITFNSQNLKYIVELKSAQGQQSFERWYVEQEVGNFLARSKFVVVS